MDKSVDRPVGVDQPQVRRGAALIVDIARTVELRSQQGEAVAGERIRTLLQHIIAAAGDEGGQFIKSYGDDVLAVFEGPGMVAAAARTAIRAQRLARAAELALYAGLHSGDIAFRQTMGHPDAMGQTINIAARLHKLTEGVPGRIFLAAASVEQLTPALRAAAKLFGRHSVKGVGELDIWTLNWEDSAKEAQTLVLSPSSVAAPAGERDAKPRQHLRLQHAGRTLPLSGDDQHTVGRGANADLQLTDPEARMSTIHLQLEYSSGHWFVRDTSRNGTWLQDDRNGEITVLPKNWPYVLPPRGALCLGRPFELDADGQFSVQFEIDT